MVYKTLHWYIIRELLRIFLMTAMSLTTLLAFCGMFKPLTKQGLDVDQLMILMLNLMPAMLAYAIPIAALFAAVIVYWRMSTDNEVTACRAGGISFVSLVVPAFTLGMVVASIDLVFVNFVVPKFLQRTERIVRRDIGSLIVNQIQRQGKFEFSNLALYADTARLEKADGGASVVVLDGMAGTYKNGEKAGIIALARQAILTITDRPEIDAAEMRVRSVDGAGFTASMQKVSGSVDSLMLDGKPWVIESLLKSRPKFMNLRELLGLNDAPRFPPVARGIEQIRAAYREQQIAAALESVWRHAGGKMTFDLTTAPGAAASRVSVQSPRAALNPSNGALTLLGTSGNPVTVNIYVRERLQSTYTADRGDVSIVSGLDPSGVGTTASLELKDHVTRENHQPRIPATSAGTQIIPNIMLDPQLAATASMPAHDLLEMAGKSTLPVMQLLARDVNDQITRLYQEIDSELNSRGSFSLSCLMLVLFGAALGLLLRGKNPLAVFVIGFVPAIVMVLLITAGRQVAEGNVHNQFWGIALIWTGNAILLLLVISVYTKLLRH